VKSKTWLPVILLLLWTPAIQAELTLKPIHPAEPVQDTLNQRFSLQNALANMESINGFLESFRRLTAAAKGKINKATWKEIGNTEWDVQTLGFANLPRAVEGALRHQNWLLKKALHRLAVMEMKGGKTAAQKTEQARQEMDQAEKEFQSFWDSMSIAD